MGLIGRAFQEAMRWRSHVRDQLELLSGRGPPELHRGGFSFAHTLDLSFGKPFLAC